MFTRFRPTRNWVDGTDEPSIEVLVPPFHKQRMSLTPTACVRCRVKKMKCTGEPHGCRGCLAKDVECTYPTAAKRSSPELEGAPVEEPPRAQQRHQNKRQQQKQQVPRIHGHDCLQAQDLVQPSLLTAADIMTPELGLDDFIDFQSTEDFERVGEATPVLSDLFLNPSPDGPREATYAGALEPPKQPVKRSAGLPSPDDTVVEVDDESRRAHKRHCQVRSGAPPCGDRSTSCVDEVLAAYDAIRLDTALSLLEHDASGGSSDEESAEVGTRHDRVSAYDLLGSQKKAMATSEALLGCAGCCGRSEAMTLLVSMAEGILTTMESLWLSPAAQDDAGKERTTQRAHPHSGQRQPSRGLSPERARDRIGGRDRGRDMVGQDGSYQADTKKTMPPHGHSVDDAGLLGLMLRDGPSSLSSSSSREWVLDQDEERHLFHSLLVSRLGRFERLLAALGRQIPPGPRGTAHRVLLHGLRSRFLREREALAGGVPLSAVSPPSNKYRGIGPETPTRCRWPWPGYPVARSSAARIYGS